MRACGVVQMVMYSLVRRYVSKKAQDSMEGGVTEDDLNEIKQDISSFRFELVEILRNNGMFIPSKFSIASTKTSKLYKALLVTSLTMFKSNNQYDCVLQSRHACAEKILRKYSRLRNAFHRTSTQDSTTTERSTDSAAEASSSHYALSPSPSDDQLQLDENSVGKPTDEDAENADKGSSSGKFRSKDKEVRKSVIVSDATIDDSRTSVRRPLKCESSNNGRSKKEQNQAASAGDEVLQGTRLSEDELETDIQQEASTSAVDGGCASTSDGSTAGEGTSTSCNGNVNRAFENGDAAAASSATADSKSDQSQHPPPLSGNRKSVSFYGSSSSPGNDATSGDRNPVAQTFIYEPPKRRSRRRFFY
jgi:hypothetical protein